MAWIKHISRVTCNRARSQHKGDRDMLMSFLGALASYFSVIVVAQIFGALRKTH